jgi:beta-lactamase superfamily II metal-dependent hydrolase
MLSTHPDDDHVNGLITVMEREDVTVGEQLPHPDTLVTIFAG